MDTTVTFYNNSSNAHVVNKALSLITTVQVKLKEPIDIERPEILLSGAQGAIKANYVHIPELGRYYYCHSELERGQLVRFVCDQSDPLMSFKSALLASPALISRNPWQYDLYIPDSDIPIEARSARAVIKFPNSELFNGNQNAYILTVLGSGTSGSPPTNGD